MSWMSRSGSQGTDYSINPAAVPLSGYTIIKTIAANPRRNFIEVQNQSTDLIQIVRDDPAPGGSGAQVTTIMLNGAGAAGAQGGNWTSDTFKGRLRIYAPTANIAIDQVAAYED